MSIDSIGDFLTIIRNGVALGKRDVVAPYSKMKMGIASVLKKEGFIKDCQMVEEENSSLKKIKIVLKYVDGESVIHELTRISTPGRRTYGKAHSMRPIIGKFGVSILTTNKGIMTDKQAQHLSVGGEIVCSVW